MGIAARLVNAHIPFNTSNTTQLVVLAAAAFVGQFMGIAAWLVDAHIQFNAINTT